MTHTSNLPFSLGLSVTNKQGILSDLEINFYRVALNSNKKFSQIHSSELLSGLGFIYTGYIFIFL